MITAKLYEMITESREYKQQNSFEYMEQNTRCHKIYDELLSTLNKDQSKLLLSLDMENFKLEGLCSNDSFKEGIEKGFKAAIRFIIDGMHD